MRSGQRRLRRTGPAPPVLKPALGRKDAFGGHAVQDAELAGGQRLLVIGARERLMLIQVGAEQILIAVTAAGVTHLHTLAQPIEPPADEPWSGDFAGLLERFKRGGKPGSTTPP